MPAGPSEARRELDARFRKALKETLAIGRLPRKVTKADPIPIPRRGTAHRCLTLLKAAMHCSGYRCFEF